MKVKLPSLFLLGTQLVCLAYLLWTGFLFARPPWIWPELLGLGVIGWAVYTMQPRQLTPFPELRPGARLVTRGPYRWIRHPMYSGLLLATLALVINTWTTARAAIWLVFLIDLIFKLEYEESLLAGRFPEYAKYRQRTRRLIPFVY